MWLGGLDQYAATLPPPVPREPETRTARTGTPRPGDSLAALNAAWGQLCAFQGRSAARERKARLRFTSQVVGRPVTSSNELTRDEQWRVARAINAYQATLEQQRRAA